MSHVTHWMPLPAAPGVQAENIWESNKMREFYVGAVRDAERYRWLRENHVDSYLATGKLERLDDAIDEAMANGNVGEPLGGVG